MRHEESENVTKPKHKKSEVWAIFCLQLTLKS